MSGVGFAWDYPEEFKRLTDLYGENDRLRSEVDRLKVEAAIGRRFYTAGPDCKKCGKPTASGYLCFYCGQDQGLPVDKY